VGTPLRLLPGWFPIPSWQDGRPGIQTAGSTDDENDGPYWAFDNYQGYEAVEEWPEFRALLDTMEDVGRREGCGRAMWEYEDELDRYGTSMSLMLLPYFTHGCIGSMEGLYFESSATTPYHFLNAALTSARPSNPQRDVPYGPLDLTKGIPKLREFGVRYYMAFSPAALAQASANPGLRLLATVPYTRDCSETEEKDGSCPKRWDIFRVLDADLVAPLTFEPAVVTGVGQSQTGGWLDVAVAQYQDPIRYPVPLAADGPAAWQRALATIDKSPGERTYGVGTEIAGVVPRPLPPVVVSAITQTDDHIRFRVDRTGVPVVVRTSYFPNWRASGASGPYRLAPNLMVVVPTRNDVSLSFRRDGADWLGLVLSGFGLVALVSLARIDRRRPDDPEPSPLSGRSHESVVDGGPGPE
jgi:hypothetical protein